MDVLVIHQSFPGQFKHVVKELLQRGDQVTTVTTRAAPKNLPEGLRWHTYQWRRGNAKDVHPLAKDLETKMIRAEALAVRASELKKQGYQPDLIVGHPGWGELLLVGEVWPQTPQIHYLEFFFGVPGTDSDLDDEFASKKTLAHRAKLKARNAPLLLGMEAMSAGLTPTQFQRSVLPTWAQQKTSVIHEGVDTNWLAPEPKAVLKMGSRVFRHGDPVITFVNRTYEPYRGIHIFLRALSQVQRRLPELQVVMVGSDKADVSYGSQRSDGQTWLQAMRTELGDALDWSRIHLLGRVNHEVLRCVYRISAAHVYLTYPFVLSWSAIEAMSCGCLLIGSDTAPVREVVEEGKTGWLTPFQDSQALAGRMFDAINQRQSAAIARIRREARAMVRERYEVVDCVNEQIRFFMEWA